MAPVQKRKKNFVESDIQKALECVDTGASIRSTAKLYGMSESYLRLRRKMRANGKQIGHQGRRPALSADAESYLANCISTLNNLGFSPSAEEIKAIVEEYVVANNIQTPFKNKKPGKDWLYGFMKRNNIKFRKAETICAARKSVTENPFVIYGFYDILEKLYAEKRFQAHQIWNCDESGFPHDPSKLKVLAKSGSRAFKTTAGPGRSSTTTLAVANAAGKCLEPLVVFQGKHFYNSWKSDSPETRGVWYACSDKGWMTAEVFSQWFNKFVALITDRPLLLLFDGHSTHLTLQVIELARDEDITIVKLPSHTTDLLQPLDVSCFGPMKRKWETQLSQYQRALSNSKFVELLCNIWGETLSAKNIKSGFASTGIFPLDKNKYPVNRLNSSKLQQYNKWVKDGKPSANFEQLSSGIGSTPKKAEPSVGSPEKTRTPPSLPKTSTPGNHAEGQEIEPAPAPQGKKWVRTWSLVDADPAINETDQEPGPSRSFEEIIRDRIKPQQSTSQKPDEAVKRRRVRLEAKIVTSDEFHNAIVEREMEERRKNQPKTPLLPRRKPTARDSYKKSLKFAKNTAVKQRRKKQTTVSANKLICSIAANDQQRQRNEMSSEMRSILLDVRKSLDDDKKGVFYAAYYDDRYYWGRILHVFANDEEDDVDTVQIDFLRYQKFGFWDFPSVKDSQIVDVKYLFCGPCTPSETTSEGYKFNEDGIAALRYKELKNLWT